MVEKSAKGRRPAGAAKAKAGRQGQTVNRKRRLAVSRVRKRSAKIGSYMTSVSVEDEFWQGVQEIARERELPLNTLITDIHKNGSMPTFLQRSDCLCWTTIAGWRRRRRRTGAMTRRIRRPRSPLDPTLPYFALILLGAILFVALYTFLAR
jgi:predicted DNA-binding ribbon-helix-helix protein